jgi:S1-C subfamily serine protease
MKHIPLCLAIVAVAAAAWAHEPPAAASGADPRRTPAVEIFQRYKDAVVYLTGPMLNPREPAVEEFFVLSPRRVVTSLGSGCVIHPSGYVLANAHAVERPFFHEVTLSDGRRLPAELLAVVRQHDLALLKVEASRPLTAVKLARDGDLMIGEPVIVIGNPQGLLLTCTTGVLSAVGRATQPSGLPGITLHGMIQTDAAINPGSSGGPWFNALGEVIGVTAAQKLNAENIAFGVPVATIRHALPEMLDVERRQGITTGLQLQPFGPCGVTAVAAGSPAATAGLQPRDVLTKLDGQPLAGRLDWCFALLGRKPHESLRLELSRDGVPMHTLLVLGDRPKPDGAAILKTRYGLTAVPLDKAKADATSLRVRRGVVITEVAKGPPWNYDKLQSPPLPGDVLARIDSIRPRDLDHVGLLLDRIPPKQKVVMVLLRKTGDTVTRVDLTTLSP